MKNVRLRRTLATCLILAILLSLSVFSVPSYALTEGDWTYEVTDGKATVTACALTSGNITIPSTLGGYPVTALGDNLFKDKTNITGVTIPDGVTSIGNYVFYFCRYLTSITIPDSVTSIGNNAFSGCQGLTSITIPDSITSIGVSTFAYCISLTSITIPDSVTSIGRGAFSGCQGLTSITIPNSVTTIGISAFDYCRSLTSVTIPDGVTTIGVCAFAHCTNLTSISIPDSVTRIAANAFAECSSLKSVSIPNGVTQIEGYVFFRCSSLKSVTIPDGVTTIIPCAFEDCISLTSIEFPDSLTNIMEVAFIGCGLTSITIPDSVHTIGDSAFSRCANLSYVDLGHTISIIRKDCFISDNKITKVICRGNAPNIEASAFTSTAVANMTIFYDPSTSGWPVGSDTYTSNGVTYKIAPLSALEIPAVPTNLSAVGGMNKVDLIWDAATGAQSYTVMYSTASDMSSPTTADFTTNSASITGLLNSIAYYFVVRSNNLTGSSDYSGTVSATTLADDATFTIKPPLRVVNYTAPSATTYHLIRGLQPNGSSVSTVMSTYFSITNGSWKLYSLAPATGAYTEINQTDTVTKVGSGFKIEIYNAANALTNTYYMAILGDVTCDGLINIQDSAVLKNHIGGISAITNEIQYYCGDVMANTPAAINIQDVTAVKKHVAGITPITQ